jgi:hypothetical protein
MSRPNHLAPHDWLKKKVAGSSSRTFPKEARRPLRREENGLACEDCEALPTAGLRSGAA